MSEHIIAMTTLKLHNLIRHFHTYCLCK